VKTICFLVLIVSSICAQAESLCLEVFKKASTTGFPNGSEVLAIIQVESNFKPKAKYQKSVGLMMVRSESPKRRKELLRPSENIQAGVVLLESYYGLLGSKKAAVEAYNIGIGSYLKGQFKKSAAIYWHKFEKSERKINEEYDSICS
jgi:soluble lytic murein transglycosylase-like protein